MPANQADVTTDGNVDPIKEKYVKDNQKAVSALTLALEGNQVFQLLTTGTNSDWPDGAAFLVCESLDRQYHPQDLVAEVEMESKLMQAYL